MSMNTTQRRVHIELNRQFLSWCSKNNLSLKENSEVFFVNERLLMKPEYIINDKIFVDILKTGEFKEENLEFYQIFAESFGTLILIKEDHIWSLDGISKQDLEDRHSFSF
jgi:hypothetical protein